MASTDRVGPARPRRGRSIGRWVVAALLVVPLVEIFLIVFVGQQIGAWWTFGLLLAMCVLGAWLVRREGGRTWRALQTAVRAGQPPAKELTDAALVLVGGTMLLTPGFLTDLVGLFLVLPFTRPLTRVWLQQVVASRLLGSIAPSGAPNRGGSAGPAGSAGPRRRRRPEVIEGEIVQDPSPQDPPEDQPGPTREPGSA